MAFDRDLFFCRILGNRDFWASAVEIREIHPKSVFEHPMAINHILKEICEILEMPFAFVLGRVSGDKKYIYPLDKIEKILNRLKS